MSIFKLNKLKNNLLRLGLYKYTASIDYLIKISEEEVDWDVDLEERMLSPQRIEQEEESWSQFREKKEEEMGDKERRRAISQRGWFYPEESEDSTNERILKHLDWLSQGRVFANKRWFESAIFGAEKIAGREERIKFIKDNLEVFDKVFEKYGNKRPKPKGAGASAQAWELGTGQIFKITADNPEVAYDKELSMFDKEKEDPGAKFRVMIHDYGDIEHYKYPLYWVIVEKLKTMKEVFEGIGDIDKIKDLDNVLHEIRRQIEWNPYTERILGNENIEEFIDYLASDIESKTRDWDRKENSVINTLEEKVGLNPGWLFNMIKQMIIGYSIKRPGLLRRSDFHINNIGMRDLGGEKYLVFFDQ